MADPNLALLVGMAQAMGPLCDQVVFVGGCATGLLIDDADLMDVRPTEDVDAIVEVTTLAGYHALAEQLMQRGFKQTMAENTPPFRWYWNRMQLDLVPLDEKVLGFANPGLDLPPRCKHPLLTGWCYVISRRRISWQRSLRRSRTGGRTMCTPATIWKTS